MRVRFDHSLMGAIALIRDMRLIASSGLFDREFYLAENPDVAKVGVNPLVHFIRRGGFEGRDPNAYFDSDWYLEQYPTVAKAGVNPLVDYLRHGAAEGRKCGPILDSNCDMEQKSGRENNGRSPAFDLLDYVLWRAQISRMLTFSRTGWKSASKHRADAPAKHVAVARQSRPRIVFVSGESYAPGHQYRVINMSGCLAPAMFETVVIKDDELSSRLSEVAEADVLWIWRARWSQQIAVLIETARRAGAKIIFDVDDLMFRSELANAQTIDGIRSQGLNETEVQKHYALVHAVLAQADHCTAPTVSLAREIYDCWKPATVIPNGFDRRTFEAARSAYRTRRANPGDGLIRIGYAAGTRTHQRDLAVASSAIVTLLRENSNVRLVLFRGTVELDEFSDLKELSDQIEWRDQVPIEELPREYARFDVNLAPLEIGNRFCEAKSELKFFDAALVGVPTIASPTRPFTEAIQHGETGFLAKNEDEWCTYLRELVRHDDLRQRMAACAYHKALWLYGPERRALLVTRLVNRLLAPPHLASELFRLQTDAEPALSKVDVPDFDVLYQSPRRRISRVSVIVPLFNYAHFLEEALDSVHQQTMRDVDLIVVDDQSTDSSVAIARTWLDKRAADFNMVALLQNRTNSQLARTRNAGVSFSDTECFLPLDADNVLLPDCIDKCLAALDESGAAFSYPTIQRFGDATGTIAEYEYDSALFQCGNYIDAMAMIRKACWIAVGGYTTFDAAAGLEDYEFWCKFAEKGFFGTRVPKITAMYRVHGTSMLRTVTSTPENHPRILRELNLRHPWLEARVPGVSHNGYSRPKAVERCSGTEHHDKAHEATDRIQRLLPMLRCPDTGEELVQLDENTLVSGSTSRRWPVVQGRPVFTPEGDRVSRIPDWHRSNEIPREAVALIEQTEGFVLNLSAGGTSAHYANVIEVEYSIFRNTDVIADAHRLPFKDEVFQTVVCLNAFEHYREPFVAANEIWRVLKRGGRLFLHTAFLQPLHESPHHYYNCTKFGLLRWLQRFQVELVRVSDNLNPAYALSWLASEVEDGFSKGVSGAAAATFREARLREFVKFWREPGSRTSQLWRAFYDLPPSIQEKLAAGWEAIARKDL